MTTSVDLLRKFINRKVLLHSTFWVILLLIVFISENWEHQSNFKFSFFIHYVMAFLIFVAVSYFNIYFLIPRYIKQKRYFLYIVWLISIVFIGSIITLLLQFTLRKLGLCSPDDELIHGNFAVFYFFHVMFGEIMFIIATSFFFIMEEWIRLQGITIKMQEIESKKIHTELQALKAQINPHFLFNTLNNIYSHSLEKSPRTPEMILKLSELMSYILYECHEEMVPVKNELNFIRNYIELEKIRFEDNLLAQLNIIEQDTNQKIVPLLFIAFIENAFKHVGNAGKAKPYVNVNILIESSKIELRVINSVFKETTKKASKESGIGIENVRKRLDLLYPERYKLDISEKENEFCVNLTIRNI